MSNESNNIQRLQIICSRIQHCDKLQELESGKEATRKKDTP